MAKHKLVILVGSILLSTVGLTACGGGSSSTDAATGGDENTTGGATDSGMIGIPDNSDIASAIKGAWVSDCEVLASGALSARQIFVINDTQLIRDWYEFDGGLCAGVPRGKRYPLLVDEYTLGADFVTEDGIAAKEIDLTLQQLPEVDYKPGFGEVVQTGLDVGDQRFTVVSYADGKLLWQDREPTNAENRFTDFNNGLELVPHVSLSSPDLSAADLYGTYKSACRATTDGNYTYNVTIMGEDNIERYQDHFFFNYLCLGEPVVITETPSALEYGSVFTNDFGDTLISASRTRQQQFVVKGAELFTAELKPPRATRYTAYALLGDTMLNGDCIIRVEECKNTPELPADHIDFEFNSHIRNVRTDSADPIAGTQDTAAVAGTWDGTYEIEGVGQDIYYYVISDNGLVTYYDYRADTLGDDDDCYFIYTENLTYFGNDKYLYEGVYEDGEAYSYAEIVTVTEGGLTFIGSDGSGITDPQFTGDVSSLNECV